MRNLLIGLTVLFMATPAQAALDHWTCTNNDTMMFMVLNTNDMTFHLWDATGRFILTSKFTKKFKAEDGTPVSYAEIANGGAVWISKPVENVLNLAISKINGDKPELFVCV